MKVVDNAYSILIVLDITWFFGRLFSSLLQVYWGKQSNGQANKMMPIIKRTILVRRESDHHIYSRFNLRPSACSPIGWRASKGARGLLSDSQRDVGDVRRALGGSE